MLLKPQDILVLLKLVALGRRKWSYASLAADLGMSSSQLHSAVRRALAAGLALRSGEIIVPNLRNLEEFLVHGLRYAFIAERGQLTRGMPTAYAAPPLSDQIVQPDEPPPVWPEPQGEVRGVSFSPIYKFAPQAARADEKLYKLLALVDAIRDGSARERAIAIKELKGRLDKYA